MNYIFEVEPDSGEFGVSRAQKFRSKNNFNSKILFK